MNPTGQTSRTGQTGQVVGVVPPGERLKAKGSRLNKPTQGAGVGMGGGYSAEVGIWLVLGGREFPVAQLGPGFVLFDEEFTAGDGPGEMVLSVDGRVMRWRVWVCGMMEKRARIERLKAKG